MAAVMRTLGKRETSTVTGATVKRLFGTTGASGNTANRVAVQVCNHDATFALYLKLITAGVTLPTVSGTDHDMKVAPGDTAILPAGSSLDVAILNSSGGATASAYSALEVRD